MSEQRIETLLSSLEAPEPSASTKQAVLEKARKALAKGKPPALEISSAPASVIRPRPQTSPTVYSARPKRTARFWTRVGLGLAALLALVAGLWAVMPWYGSASPQVLAEVTDYPIEVERAGVDLILEKGQALLAGDVLTFTTKTEISMQEHGTLKGDVGAILILREPRAGERVLVNLHTGRIFANVTRRPGHFVILGSAEVRVLGTRFGVTEKAGGTGVHVIDGTVSLKTGETQLLLKRGEAGEGKAGSPPVRIGEDADEAVRWALVLKEFKAVPLKTVLAWFEENSSYRFELGKNTNVEVKVSVVIGNEPIRQTIEAVLLSSGLEYWIDSYDVTLKEQ